VGTAHPGLTGQAFLDVALDGAAGHRHTAQSATVNRLYELDRIISRVVSYALITALLVGVYTGLVLLATHALPIRSAVGVAVATLITAALFNPLRKRVQRLVDRRFNRSRYDAEALVAAFTTRMRHTVDFDAVRGDLVGVVHEAFQPTQVSMWLVEAGSGHEPGSVRG
jgi:hypothetical protein